MGLRRSMILAVGAIAGVAAISLTAAAIGAQVAGSQSGAKTAVVTTVDLTRSFSASGTLRAGTTWTLVHQADPVTVTTTVSSGAANGFGGRGLQGTSNSTDAGPVTVTQQVPSSAHVTALPDVGAVVPQGGVLYATDDQPTVLLPGTTAAWRTLAIGVTDGPDVAQLESYLSGAGYDVGSLDAHFDASTARAVRTWQAAIGRKVTGSVELGSVVFAPSALTVESVKSSVGASVGDGDAVLVVRSADVVADLTVGTDLAPYLAPGDEVSVRLTGSSAAAKVQAVVHDPERGLVAIATFDKAPPLSVTPVPVTATRTITVATHTLAVPAAAVVHLDGNIDAVRRENGSLVHVTLGPTAGANVAVTSTDLHDGDTVIVP